MIVRARRAEWALLFSAAALHPRHRRSAVTRIRLLSLAAVSILGAGLVAGCGGDDGGDEDPQQVIDETFSNDQEVNSGVIDLSLSGSAEGEDAGNIDASLSGPFQGDENE